MACPFFVPTNRAEDILWLHSSRLPLGAGWNGHCDAPGHHGLSPTPEEVRDHCNLGYAASCTRLPKQRHCDAVRFAVSRDCFPRLTLRYILESAHLPAGDGMLEYDVSAGQWTSSHLDERIQRMANCYIESYLSRKGLGGRTSPVLEKGNATDNLNPANLVNSQGK